MFETTVKLFSTGSDIMIKCSFRMKIFLLRKNHLPFVSIPFAQNMFLLIQNASIDMSIFESLLLMFKMTVEGVKHR